MNLKMNAMYFSPTDTTKKIVSAIAGNISDADGRTAPPRTIDFTLPGVRTAPVSFSAEDLLIIGVPVYAGRVPNVLLDYFRTVTGNGALAVAVVVFGNRNYDDALIELKDILERQGFTVVAAGAFIGEHSFSRTLGAHRPDENDLCVVNEFARKIHSKLTAGNRFETVAVKGNIPYRPYYVVKNENGKPVYDFRKITPKTNDNCIDCKLCAEVCPMGTIDFDDVSVMTGICIKCCACIKKCPVEARYFDDPDFIMHKEDLEATYQRRSEPELFL